MSRTRILVVAIVAAVACILAVPSRPALADNSFVIDTTDWDLTLTKTACSPSPSDCSYRGAVIANAASNGSVVRDVVTFDPSVFPPGAPATIQQITTGTTTVSNITIDGAGAGVIWRGVGSSECISLNGTDITVRNLQVTHCVYGVWLFGSGNTMGPGLVISDSAAAIKISNGSSMKIIGNRIGTTADGTALHPGGPNGIGIDLNYGGGHTVGGSTDAERNLISGNTTGIAIAGYESSGLVFPSSNNTVINNYIGTDITGTVDFGNGTGVRIGPFATGNVIGGNAADRNVISGNTNYNVRMEGPSATNNTVTRNFIGLNVNGVAGAMTNGDGVSIGLGSSGNTIGPRNVISNNTNGVRLLDSGTNSNVIKGNFIGTTVNGMGVISNTNGVVVSGGARNNMIGGLSPLDGNVIAGNTARGVRIDGTSGVTVQNSIRSNAIYDNGLFLLPGDQIDNVSGGNTELPSPFLSWSDGVTVKGATCPNCSVDIFTAYTNHPHFFEGSTTAGSGGNFTFTSSSALTGTYVTATATDLDGNTSEVFYWLVVDADGDGFNDAVDPDDDNDGVLDANDLCPTQAEDVDGFQDGDGCPDPDNDSDGICDSGQTALSCTGSDTGKMVFDPAGTLSAPTLDCRNIAEDYDAFKDGDGCPEPDNDNDGFPDATDACPGTDAQAGLDGMLGSPQDLNHNGIRDGAEALLSTDDIVLTFEDWDGVIDADGCHDSPGDDFDGDSFGVLQGNLPVFNDEREALFFGTNPTQPCAATPTPDDETGPDAWPPDFNDDQTVDIQDLNVLRPPVFFSSPPNPNYTQRYDLTADGIIDIQDVNVLRPPIFFKNCAS